MEYYAALSPWAVFNVHRKEQAQYFEPMEFMLRRRARLQMNTPQPAQPRATGTPAIIRAPVPATGMRYALPGERPPSRYSADNPDPLFDRLDAVARQAIARQGVRHG